MIEVKVEILFKRIYENNHISASWITVQEQIEECLNMGHSRLSLIQPLAWEQWLRALKNSPITSSTGHYSILYAFRIGLWLFLSIMSSLIGVFLTTSDYRYVRFLFLGLFLTTIYIILVVVFAIFLNILNADTSIIQVIYINSEEDIDC